MKRNAADGLFTQPSTLIVQFLLCHPSSRKQNGEYEISHEILRKRRTEIKAYALLENSEIAEIECFNLPEIGDDVLGRKVVASGLSREAMELIRGIMQETDPDKRANEREAQESQAIKD